MKIKMEVSCATANYSFTKGKVYDVEEYLAEDFIKAGHAKKLSRSKPIEKAVKGK